VKFPGRLVCVSAWSLAAVAQTVIILSAPQSIIVSGVDLGPANAIVQRHQLIFIGVGLALAVVGYWGKKWAPPFVIVSSALYLIHWFPFKFIYDYGLAATFNTKLVLGSIPGLRWSSFIRDIVLPIAFATSIVFVLLEMRRERPLIS
jgi:hypothetical protein